MPESSGLEQTFDSYWFMLCDHLPAPLPEYRFAKPRRFRFDRAWPEQKIAVELEGGVYTGGRHTRGSGFEADCEKYNLATAQGWRVLRYTANMLKNDPTAILYQISKLLVENGARVK